MLLLAPRHIGHVRRLPMPASVRPLFRDMRGAYLLGSLECWLYETARALVDGYHCAEEALEDADAMSSGGVRFTLDGHLIDAPAIRWAVATLGAR